MKASCMTEYNSTDSRNLVKELYLNLLATDVHQESKVDFDILLESLLSLSSVL